MRTERMEQFSLICIIEMKFGEMAARGKKKSKAKENYQTTHNSQLCAQ